MRESGYYWVKWKGGWIMAEWDNGWNEWNLFGDDQGYDDSDFDQIDERRIERE